MTGVILDTSVWIDYFRDGSSAEARDVSSLIASDRVVLVGIVYAELLRGARTPRDAETLAQSLEGLPYLEFDKHIWRYAGELLASLERTGQRIPVQDALIAAIAIQNDLAVFSHDRHFRRIADLTLYEPESI